tara:strand:+ start:95276 stop:97198 length:1923 start_codon:yes stop_codon:yes gene_type:complete
MAMPLTALPATAETNNESTLSRIDLQDFRGRLWTLDDFADDSLLVVAFMGTECPLAKLYAVRLAEIASDYESRSVKVIAVMSNRQDSLAEIASFASRQELTFPVLKDAGNRLADDLKAQRTPEMFVFDAQRKLRYRGRVDDQYGIGYVRDEPRRKDLRIALEELLSGREVSVPRTGTVGCIIGRTKSADPESEITYGSHVAPILARRCVECHRDGEIAPFSLTDYDEVAGWADMIAEVVAEKRMPPWHATTDHAEFANDRSMTDEEKQTLIKWADAGAPAGDLSDLPELPPFVAGWQLPREPDRVFDVSPKPFDVPASGAVRYQYFRVDPKFTEDVWLEAAELKPGNREVVHHILAFAVPKGQRVGDGARGFLVGYVPGARVEPAPKGYAKRIKAGSELIFQVHYTPIGTPQEDQSQLGLVFAHPDSITHEVITTSAVQHRLSIPPGEPDYTVSASSPRFPEDAVLLSMSPHMHVRGKSYRYELESRGKRETILDIPEYDFNWQTTYALAEPRHLDGGERFLCTAVFDNSEENLNNPDPTQTVHWGDQTWDEMMIGYYHFAVPLGESGDTETANAPSRRERAAALIRNAVQIRKFDQLDGDGDGKLARRETPRLLWKVFDQLDADGDKILTRDEVVFGNN